MRLAQIIELLEAAVPLSLQEDWDNSGLQVGDPAAEVERVLLTTDVTEAVLQEAQDRHCQLVVSHHPLLFHGLKCVSTASGTERCVRMAVKQGISIYSGHTNFDNWEHGVNERIGQKMGLTELRTLVAQADGSATGLGKIGQLPTPLSEKEFLQLLQARFHTEDIRHSALLGKPIRTVALCGGAGSDFTPEAIRQGADAYVSADFRHHEFYDADGQLLLADIGHWESEQYTKELFQELLQDKIECHMANHDKSPILHFK